MKQPEDMFRKRFNTDRQSAFSGARFMAAIGVLLTVFFLFGAGSALGGEISLDGTSLFDEHGSVMMVIDPENGMILYANRAAADFYGYPVDQLVRMNIGQFNRLTPEEIDAEMAAAASEQRNFFVFEHKAANGEIRQVHVYSYPFEQDGRQLLFSIVHDMTGTVALEEKNVAINRTLLAGSALVIGFLLIGGGLLINANRKLRKKSEQLENFNELRQTFIDADDAMTTLKDGDLRYVFSNRLFLAFAGRGEEAVLGFRAVDVLDEGLARRLEELDREVQEKGRLLAGELEYGDQAFRVTKFPVRMVDGTDGVGTYIHDVTEEIRRKQEIEFLSYHDSLTGLYNRRFFEEEMRRLDVPRRLPLSILMGDVNGLKLTNDVFGHHWGDELLRKVAGTLQEVCRSDDICARWGGDEFVLLLPETGPEQARKIMERIRAHFATQKVRALQGSIALGLATKTSGEQDLMAILSEAEEQMYRDKALGNGDRMNRAVLDELMEIIFSARPGEREHARRVSALSGTLARARGLEEPEVRKAVEAGYYHDIGKVALAETLLRQEEPLSAQQEVDMHNHTLTGYRILHAFEETMDLADIVLAHHEHWDGSGSPKGLAGQTIPLLARIIGLVEFLDRFRVQEAEKSRPDNREIARRIRGEAGSRFDPDLAEAVAQMLEENRFSEKNYEDGWPDNGL